MATLSNTFVCLMGMGTVFIGLICIVLICKLTSMIVRSIAPNSNANSTLAKSVSAPDTNAPELPPAEKSAVIAGVCAVIAEELGTDANNIKVLSFKKV